MKKDGKYRFSLQFSSDTPEICKSENCLKDRETKKPRDHQCFDEIFAKTSSVIGRKL